MGQPGNNLLDVDFINRLDGLAVGDAGEILQTSDGGINWTDVSGSVTSSDLKAVDQMDEQVAVAVGLGGTIVRSADGGASWALISSPVSNDLRGVSGWDGFFVAVGDAGTVLTSSDGGVTFTENLTYPGTDTVFDVCATSTAGGGTLIYAATQDAIYVSADGGWNLVPERLYR
ncbi:MAG: YCF48-related protein [Acidobacteriota bacterium]|nr:YCF48-related protein [Acidobacteriota bacterium]